MNWEIATYDDNISLHDNLVDAIIIDENITFIFNDGFDVTKEHSKNSTGRHKHTGKSAVIMKNAKYINGESYDTSLSISLDKMKALNLEILSFDFDKQSKIVKIDADTHNPCDSCTFTIRCTEVIYCWNEFTDDAWFQDWNTQNL